MFRYLATKFYNVLFPADGETTFNSNVETPMNRASIVPTETGRYAIVTSNGLVKSYARARDARRGALRMGLLVA